MQFISLKYAHFKLCFYRMSDIHMIIRHLNLWRGYETCINSKDVLLDTLLHALPKVLTILSIQSVHKNVDLKVYLTYRVVERESQVFHKKIFFTRFGDNNECITICTWPRPNCIGTSFQSCFYSFKKWLVHKLLMT